MRKTSVYLSDTERDRLAQLAAQSGTSQAEVIRAALADYAAVRSDRSFALFNLGARARSSDTRSIADIPDEELLEGFGE